jgi:peptide chain release factor 2
MQDDRKALVGLLDQIKQAMTQLDIVADEAALAELDEQMAATDFWSDSGKAGETSQRAAGLRKHIQTWRELERETAEILELAELEDESVAEEIHTALTRLTKVYGELEFELKLSGEYDKNSALVSVYAGTGGTDAQDWAEMLLRMYLRFAEQQGYGTEILDQSNGEEAGIKSVTFEVNGPYAFGKLKSEKGVHRLVRLSPFNSDNLRQTSFALVDIMPQLELAQEMEIDAKDLRIDVYRAGGHGGQSVNTTDSAVRITHLPTGTVVAIQNERSQLQNKEKAMAVLRSRLAVLMAEQQKQQLSDIRGATQSAEWGNQIRSYVLHPYTKVKDHRTGVETSQAQDVLNGELEPFIEGYLQSQIAPSTE